MYTLVILVFKYGPSGVALATEHVPGFETMELCDNAGRAIAREFATAYKPGNAISYVCVKTRETK